MQRSVALPKLASPVSCLLLRDTYGSHYGAHTEDNTCAGFDVALRAGKSVEKALSSVGRTGASIEEEASDRLRAAAEESGDQVRGLDKKGASAAHDKGGEFCEESLPAACALQLQGHDNTLAAPHENCKVFVELKIDMAIVRTSSSEVQVDTSGAEFLQGDESTVNGCIPLKRRSQQDLEEIPAEKRVKVGSDVQGDENITAVRHGTDLTDLLRDLGDPGDSEDDDESGGGRPSVPRSEAGPRDELTGNSVMNELEVQPQTPLTPLGEPIVNLSANISAEVEKRDDIGTKVHATAHEIVGKEMPLLEVITLDSHSDDGVTLKMFDPVEEARQLTNTVNSESGSLRQVPDGSSELTNAAIQEPQEPRASRQVPDGSSELANAVIQEPQEPGVSRQVPNGSPQVKNPVKVEPGSTRQVLHGTQSSSLKAGIVPKVEAPPDASVQMRIENGKPVPYMKFPGSQQNPLRMSMTPFGGNVTHPEICKAYNLPYRLSSGYSTSFAPNNGHAQGATSSGEQAGLSHGLDAPTTSAAAPTSRDQAGPSQRWNPPNNMAVVPFHSGASKAEPGLSSNTNLGPQSVPACEQLAVVKPCYDTTVSTSRISVARAMQNYDYYITKAKNDRAREALSTPNESVGHRRGLDCRPDIVAYNEVKRGCEDVNPGIIVGDVPGVEIGDRFTYRHQMAVVGLHRLPNVGIDYGHPPPDSIPTATAIVLMPKAGYVDDKDYGNTILYTGQGGRKKRNQAAPFVCDQELKKGNLALAKNFERKLPVRVIRGHSRMGSSNGPGFLGYTYDGLYMITKYEFSVGMNGFKVFKYSMERLEGQPPIPPCITGCTAHEWNSARGALGALPLQMMDPSPVQEDVKQLLYVDQLPTK